MTHKLTQTTIRDFGGGWDLTDSDKSLSSRFQPVSDNVIRHTDGTFSVRPGSRLFADMKQGTVDSTWAIGTDMMVTFTSGSGIIRINNAGANFNYASGTHVNITRWTPTTAGISATDISGIHGVKNIDPDTFEIYVRKNATASGTFVVNVGWTWDNHVLGGRDIFGRYFKDNLIVFSDIGEIVAVNASGTVTQLWTHAIAQGKTPPIQPWGPCLRVSAEIVKSRLIAVNGATNDKPLEILSTSGVLSCNYLLDGGSPASNASIPRADFVIAADHYVLLISTEYGPTKIDVSAKDTYYVFSRNTAPDDAVEIDLGMLTQAVDTTILGANVIRSRVFVAFQDRSLLGELGKYTTDTTPKHDPDFKDNVAMVGTFSHASAICLGNDIFCAAITGINSLSISQASGDFTPATISDLIHPTMLRHLARLSENDRRYRVFAVWDNNYRAYMLFAPKYSAISYDLPDDPVIVSNTLQPYGLAYLLMPSHTFDTGDYVTLSGLTNSADGLILAANMNGTRRIHAVVDENTLLIEVPTYPVGLNYGTGGNNGVVTPVNDETPAYVFEYNSRLKIKRWTRYRGLNFDWGCVSQLSRLYFGKNGRIYRFGNAADKYAGDKIGDYTKMTWSKDATYAVGDRVLDSVYKEVFVCLVAHVSSGSDTFKQFRDAHPTYWEPFKGFPISWELETSWSDFKDRVTNKQVELIRVDTEGRSPFNMSIFTNSIREDFVTHDLIPRRTLQFVAENAPGFGGGTQLYGGGRNTRQEWLSGMPVEGKLFRLRLDGASTDPLTIGAITLYYHRNPTALT